MRGSVALALIAALGLAGCAAERAPHTGGATAPALTFVTHSFADSSGPCGDARRRECAWVSLRWPEARGGVAADSLNAWIRVRVMAGTGERADRVEAAPESVAARFLADRERFHRDIPAASAAWFVEREVRVLLDTLGVVTLAATDESFTGGAHGMHVARHASFDARDGRRLRLADLVTDPGDTALVALGEREFRATRGIAPGQTLAEAFFFRDQGGRFAFGDDVAIARDGLLFHWDPYDIAPYAWGATTVTLPWREVARFARADGPLARFTR